MNSGAALIPAFHLDLKSRIIDSDVDWHPSGKPLIKFAMQKPRRDPIDVQIQPNPANPRATVLFELLTGQKPYTAETTSDILRMQREEPLPKLFWSSYRDGKRPMKPSIWCRLFSVVSKLTA